MACLQGILFCCGLFALLLRRQGLELRIGLCIKPICAPIVFEEVRLTSFPHVATTAIMCFPIPLIPLPGPNDHPQFLEGGETFCVFVEEGSCASSLSTRGVLQEDLTGRPESQGPWAQILGVLTDRDCVKRSSAMMEYEERAGG